MSSKNDYVSLHTHADTSALDGFGKVNEYIERTLELGQPGLGLSDHGTTAGIYSLINGCRDAGITPVPGCEFYMAPENPEGAYAKKPIFYNQGYSMNKVRENSGNGDTSDKDVAGAGAYLHLSVWAVNQKGLSNLFKLSTESFHPDRQYRKPRIDFDLLAQYSEGLVVSTGCPSGEISTRFRLGQTDKAYEYASRLRDVFRDRLFVEIMNHNMTSDLERDLLTEQMKLAKHFNLPLLATNDSHYTRAEDAVRHEEMLASQSGTKMSDPPRVNGVGKRFAFDGDQYYLKSAEEMLHLFPAHDFPNAVSNTVAITEMAQDINLSYDPHLMPKPHVPAEYPTNLAYLEHLINKGYYEKFKDSTPEYKAKVRDLVRYEVKMIDSLGFVDYMLFAQQSTSKVRTEHALRDSDGRLLVDPVGPGRGSGAGVMIAYLLGITGVNPMEHGLFVERFISPGRGDIAEVTYDDGTVERVIVSEERKLLDGDVKYIHQLMAGDEVIIETTGE